MHLDLSGDALRTRQALLLLAAFCAGAVFGCLVALLQTQSGAAELRSGLPPAGLVRRLCVRLSLPVLMGCGALPGRRAQVPVLFFVRGFCLCLCLCLFPALRGRCILRGLICLPVLFATGARLLTDEHPHTLRLLLLNAAAELLAALAEH